MSAASSPTPGPAVTCLVVGPDEHGVTGVALAQAEALRTDLDDVPPVHLLRLTGRPGATELLAALRGAPPGPVLVHVTDKLFGRTAQEAADVVVALATALPPERPLVLALHDLPQPSDGAAAFGRRAGAYRRMALAAAAVVVASHHEERLLAACGADVPCAVVPLAVPDLRHAPSAAGAALESVAVLGFLYPGKGHERVLEALDALPAGVGLTAWGRPSDGHDDLVDDLARRAQALGRTCRVTGYVPDDALPGLLRSAVLPVAPHEHLSASGSINAWLGAGRRPLVPRSDYVEELLAGSPGCVWVYDDLRTAMARAWADPASTWAPAGARSGPSPADTAALLRPVLAGVAGRTGADGGAGA